MLSIKKAIPQDAELAAGIFMMLWQGHPFQQFFVYMILCKKITERKG